LGKEAVEDKRELPKRMKNEEERNGVVLVILQLPSNPTQRHIVQPGLHLTTLMACSFIPPASPSEVVVST
jgi:hypothetical protein